jgi:tripartite-type tricarboxylate transporter receptor subunit TctC
MLRSASVLRSLAGALALTALAAAASAQDYPTKPIRLLNPYSPGGPTDAIGRPLGDKLSQALGKPVVMENKPGANGMIAFDLAARAAPDGYTLLFSHVGPMAINPAMAAGARYDPVKDFAPITLLASQQLLLGVRPSLPVRTLKELFDYAKAHPGTELSYGTVGTGSTTHLAVEWLKSASGMEATHVPYGGAGPIMVDLLAGRIDFAFLSLASLIEHVKANNVRPIAVSTPQRSDLLPDVPPASDTVPGFNVSSWYGFEAPAGTPKPIIDRLAREAGKIVHDPDMTKLMRNSGMVPGGDTPEQHAAWIKSEVARWADLVKQAGLDKK